MYASKQTPIVAVILLILISLSSCGWKADGNARLEEQYPTPGDEDEDLTEIPEVELEDIAAENLGGVWAMQMVLPGTMTPLIDPWTIILTNLFIATIDEEEKTLSLRFCDQIVQLDGAGDIGKTEVPDALKQALGDTPIEIELPGDLSLPAKKIAWLWGVTLEDPIKDNISGIEAGDSRIFDQDDDDNPGVTMRVLSPAGERYMVRRAVWDMAAGDVSEDLQWIRGTLEFRVDEVAIGASSSLLETVAPITPSEEGGTFALRRMSATDIAADGDMIIDGDDDPDDPETGEARKRLFKAGDGGYNCERLIREYKAIFATTE